MNPEIRSISSARNPKVKQLGNLLRSKKERTASGCFVAEGLRSVQSILDAPAGRFSIREIWMTDNSTAAEQLFTVCREKDIPLYSIPETLFARISDTKNAQGILGVIHYQAPELQLKPEKGRYLLLESIADPGNLGTLIRTAVAASFDGIFLLGDHAELFSPKVVRSALGMLTLIDIFETDMTLFDRLKKADYTVYAATVKGGADPFTCPFAGKSVLAIGNEANGLSAELLQRTDTEITIPMNPLCESLNAAIAGAVCMFQVAASGQ